MAFRLRRALLVLSTMTVVCVQTEISGPVDCAELVNTMKYEEYCHGVLPSSNLRQLLITGSGGIGTHTVAQLLLDSGLSAAHEGVGDDASVAWPFAVDERVQCRDEFCLGYPWGPLHTTVKFRSVFHMTRCPIKNIAAMTTHGNKSMHFMSPFFPERGEDYASMHPIERATLAFLGWNAHIEKYADYRFKVETVNVTDICARAGFPSSKCAHVPKMERQNHRSHDELTMQDVRDINPALADAVVEMGNRYGYAKCIEACRHCPFH